MARTTKEEEYSVRRKEIIAAAQKLVYTKGYEQMTIQEILDSLQISKGAFYYYFDSKQALLEALIVDIAEEVEKILIPIVQDPHLRAMQKFEQFWDAAARWKTARKEYILALLHTWYADENIIVRQKVQTRLIQQVSPLVASIIRQGIQEGVFSTPFPEQAGEIVFSLLQNFGDRIITLLMQCAPECEDEQYLENTIAAHNDTLERILGAAPGSLKLWDPAIFREWFPASNKAS